MEIGSEISNKIRSAIRAKLMDLGSYVDNELPDYIMVMVANKKTKEQMSEDLSLFLGKNTDRFTSWLDNLLKKLQSISADAEPLEQETKTDTAPPQEKPKSKTSETQTTPIKAPLLKKDASSGDKKDTTTLQKDSESATKGLIIKGKAKSTAEDAIQLTVENEELNEKTTASNRHTRETGSSRSLNQQGRSIATSQGLSTSRAGRSSTDASKDERSGQTQETRSSRYGRGMSTRGSSSRQDNSSRVSSRVTREETQTKGRSSTDATNQVSSLQSVVGKVDIQHQVEDEGYDPYHPSVGNVASTVKVSRERPVVPPSRQANKSILLRAVKEAQTSIEESLKKNLGAKKKEEKPPPRLASQSQRMTRKRPIRTLGLEIEVPNPPKSHSSTETKKSSSQVGLVSRSRREEILREFKERLKEEEEEEVKQRYEADNTPLPEEEVQDIRIFQQRSGSELQYGIGDLEDDSRDEKQLADQQVEEYVPEPFLPQPPVVTRLAAQPAYPTGYPSLPEPVKPEDDILEADDEEFDEDEIEAGFQEFNVYQQNRVYQGPDRALSPRFFVTLDGVDPDKLSQEAAMEIDEQFMTPIAKPKEGDYLKPRNPNMNFYQNPNLSMRYRDTSVLSYKSDSDGEVEIENNSSPVKKPKMSLTERCRFWPSCKNGATCPYYHPTTLCKVFPKCRFGDKCRFIHPNCKFDASCSNPSCPYTHASHRNPLAMAASLAAQTDEKTQRPALSLAPPTIVMHPPPMIRPPPPNLSSLSPEKVTCKFFPMCKNMNCPFSHPKPCRYGISCTNKGLCRFHHPELPSRSKLKWTSGASACTSTSEKFILKADDLLT